MGVPAICFNGACGLLMQSGRPVTEQRVLFSHCLHRDVASAILGFCDRLGWCASWCQPLGAAANPRNEAHERQLRAFEHIEGISQTKVPDSDGLQAWGAIENQGPLKLVAFADDPEECAA